MHTCSGVLRFLALWFGHVKATLLTSSWGATKWYWDIFYHDMWVKIIEHNRKCVVFQISLSWEGETLSWSSIFVSEERSLNNVFHDKIKGNYTNIKTLHAWINSLLRVKPFLVETKFIILHRSMACPHCIPIWSIMLCCFHLEMDIEVVLICKT